TVLRYEVFSPLGLFEREGVLPAAAVDCRATGLGDGRVLITAGLDAQGAPSATAWWVDLSTGRSSPAAPMPQPRAGHALIGLRDGGVWALGGFSDAGLLDTTLAYDVVADRWSAGPLLPYGVMNAT